MNRISSHQGRLTSLGHCNCAVLLGCDGDSGTVQLNDLMPAFSGQLRSAGSKLNCSTYHVVKMMAEISADS